VKHLLLNKLVSAFAAQFKQPRTNNISTEGNVVREKAAHVIGHL
jgi:hypothetical protein